MLKSKVMAGVMLRGCGAGVRKMITNETVGKIAEFLGLDLALGKKALSLDFLDEILFAYTRAVPWESATRNIKRVAQSDGHQVDECPRWPEEFWTLALSQGTGGTCFETNLAMFAFLQSLGFEGYLTINNMKENIGCHTAIVVELDGAKWLFDSGYPLECVLPIDPDQPTNTAGKFLDYQVTPHGDGSYEISRSRHPKPFIFTLFDTPIEIDDYKRATANDFRPEGNFNNSIVINKIVNEKVVRFSTRPGDVLFESFTADPDGGWAAREVIEEEADLAGQLADMFGMPKEILREALEIIQSGK